MSRSTSQHGFTMVEIMLALVVILALAATAFMMFPRIQASNRAQSEVNTILSAKAAIKSKYQNGDYSELNVTAANVEDIFPTAMQTSDTTLTSQFGAAVQVSGSTDVGVASAAAPSPYYRLHYASVPTDICIRIASALVRTFGAVYVGGVADPGATMIKNDFTGAAQNENGIPGACSGAPNVSMTFVGD